MTNSVIDRKVRDSILAGQRLWAGGKGAIHGDYFANHQANLPWLTAAIEGEIRKGEGTEFGTSMTRAKIAALHSSSALAVNVFGYWHGRDCAALARALEIESGIERIQFEEKFPTGVGPRSPNLDVVLHSPDGSLLAIESKFTEWLGTSGRKPLRDAYLPGDEKRWKEVGLEGAQRAAERYLDVPGFARLDVPQLLKHMLGLASQPKPWRLMLVWYREPSEAAGQMGEEIARFRELLGEDAERFSDTSYQALWQRLRSAPGNEHPGYRDYLESRYFPLTV